LNNQSHAKTPIQKLHVFGDVSRLIKEEI